MRFKKIPHHKCKGDTQSPERFFTFYGLSSPVKFQRVEQFGYDQWRKPSMRIGEHLKNGVLSVRVEYAPTKIGAMTLNLSAAASHLMHIFSNFSCHIP